MQRVSINPRADWQALANQLGFKFHTLYGEPYWDESAYYQFTLQQIESDIENPTAELHGMCLELVDKVVSNEQLLQRLHIPELYWDYIHNSWRAGDKHLYGRMDLAYDGSGPAKFYEYNADTPTSLYESAFWQWIWLEQIMEQSMLPTGCDQFNSIQERLIERLAVLDIPQPLYFACCKGTEEDRGTVQYFEDCALQAGLATKFIYVEDIGISPEGEFTDLDDYTIPALFKLYPWEWLMEEAFGPAIPDSGTHFLEPPWKAVLSNKGILPLLWEMFPNHPNLLPAYFEDEINQNNQFTKGFVRKPLLSREGSNITIQDHQGIQHVVEGPYDDSGYIIQAYHPLPAFSGNYTLVGSWVIADEPAGIGIREDRQVITKDSSRFLPHVIID
ncbi:glutathionylspermidine synthase family protein [Spartinivicinus poritis]|uniref:Glutathionylspermidine synthase family protein n=1 Tax=Spartinivicinus poritis TaxID=2994640 RepID=A0ABT5UDP0_9GAMM|nr:glutathionylspermidine synthase family protein [Spartinivicinus sp. A2-2]MDE1464468.1 glutathionylspermidine synthase family protein [Spartinivicinus sp. A2-2]